MADYLSVSMPAGAGDAGFAMGVTAIQGLNTIVTRFNNFCEELQERILPSEMKGALQPTLDLSNHYCPIDTGELRRSGYIDARRNRRMGVSAELGYGLGGMAPYAVFVHENPFFYHEPPTQYKFLQRAMDEDESHLLGRIAIAVKRRAGT